MKNLRELILFILIGGLLVVGCEKYGTKRNDNTISIFIEGNEIEVDPRILSYVKEFYDEAYKWDVPLDILSKGYIGIYVDEVPPGNFGVTFTDEINGNGFSIIDKDIIDSPRKARLVVFHELGHRYGFLHCHYKCSAIMAGSGEVLNFYNNWEAQKAQMFGRIPHKRLFIIMDEPTLPQKINEE